MSADAPNPRRLRLLIAVLVALLVGGGVWWIADGNRRLPPPQPRALDPDQPVRENLPALLEPLARDGGRLQCRAVLQRLNARGDRPAVGMDDARRRWLREQGNLDEAELAEVESGAFTPLDAHHLEACLLFRDAARALDVQGLPDRDRAAAAFAWTIRQVRLRESDGEPIPPVYILRRGWGDAVQRSLVFLALLDQLDIPGCMMVVPDGDGKRPWLPGALVGGDLLLFDARLGVPLPGPDGVATLLQVRARPELLQSLTVDMDHKYDVSLEQARRAEGCVAVPLTAWAPRMTTLQDAMKPSNPVRLAADPGALSAKIQEIVKTPPCSFPQSGGPLRLLIGFLPPEEGGNDRPVGPGWVPRVWRYGSSLVEWPLLPPAVGALPDNVDPGRRLRLQFARPFTDFYLEAGTPRDLILHGRLDEATARLVATLDRAKDQQDWLRSHPMLEAEVAAWCQKARTAQADVLIAQDEARRIGPEAEPRLTGARERLAALWSAKEAESVARLLNAAAAQALTAEASYQLALCKHEQAERARGRDAARLAETWRGVAERWTRHLEQYPKGPTEAAARCLGAMAHRASGNAEAAAMLARDVSDKVKGWERYACLYAAREAAKGR